MIQKQVSRTKYLSRTNQQEAYGMISQTAGRQFTPDSLKLSDLTEKKYQDEMIRKNAEDLIIELQRIGIEAHN